MEIDLNSGAETEGLFDTRVTMVPKTASEAQLGKLRPIAVFSVLIRAWNTAALRNHNHVLEQILHPGQRAARQGAWCCEFVALQLYRIEQLQRKGATAWGIALDLSTAYNTLNKYLPMAIAVHKGLDYAAAQLLFGWIGQVRVGYQLPLRKVGEMRRSKRGWPQGMGTSPRACDLCLLPLFEYVDTCGLAQQLCMLESWQDDLQALAENFGPFSELLHLILAFMKCASLKVNQNKSVVWHIRGDGDQVDQLRRDGWVIQDSFVSLGFVVQVRARSNKDKFDMADKEKNRVNDTLSRLKRIKHLPRGPATNAKLIRGNALLPLAYGPLAAGWAPRTRSELKRNLCQAVCSRSCIPYASPEIWLGITANITAIDDIRILNNLKLIRLCKDQPDFEDMLRDPHGTTHLSQVLLDSDTLGLTVSRDGVAITSDANFTVSWQLPVKQWTKQMGELLLTRGFLALAARRPSHFEGLKSVDIREMRRVWTTMTSWEQGLALKLWSGAVVLKNRTFYLEDDHIGKLCACGETNESVNHVIWGCRLTRHLWEGHEWAQSLPAAFNTAWLLPKTRGASYVPKWILAVKNVIRVLRFVGDQRDALDGAREELNPDHPEHPVHQQGHDWGGHVIKVDRAIGRVWCTSCLKSRTIATQGWLRRSVCAGVQRSLAIGDSMDMGPHAAVLGWTGRKRFTMAWSCSKCGIKAKHADGRDLCLAPCRKARLLVQRPL
eukprot:3488151-Amphidinium_carterae.2